MEILKVLNIKARDHSSLFYQIFQLSETLLHAEFLF